MAAVARILSTPDLRATVDRERAVLKATLDRRVARWNDVAGPLGLKYPRYMGGFFTTVFCDDPQGAAQRLKAQGLFVVPQGSGASGALRVALSSVAERDVERLAVGISKAIT
jgi:aromatic-amino-acid transaminase